MAITFMNKSGIRIIFRFRYNPFADHYVDTSVCKDVFLDDGETHTLTRTKDFKSADFIKVTPFKTNEILSSVPHHEIPDYEHSITDVDRTGRSEIILEKNERGNFEFKYYEPERV